MSGYILVTGGAGYIGSHVVHALKDAGRDVVVIDDMSRGNRAMLPADVPLIEADICDAAAVGALFTEYRPTAMMHLAARSLVGESVEIPLEYYRVNVDGTRLLVETGKRHGLRAIVYSSTASVYGAPERQPIAEDDPKQPENPYGASKLAGEWVLQDSERAGGPACLILRYFNAAGADPEGRCGQVGPASHLVKVAAQAVTGERGGLVIHGTDYPTPDGTCIRDYLHVSDIASAHLAALARLEGGAPGTACNLGTGKGASVREVLEIAQALYPGTFGVSEGPRRPGDVPELIAAAGRAETVLGWKPEITDIRDIIRSAVEWERKLASI